MSTEPQADQFKLIAEGVYKGPSAKRPGQAFFLQLRPRTTEEEAAIALGGTPVFVDELRHDFHGMNIETARKLLLRKIEKVLGVQAVRVSEDKTDEAVVPMREALLISLDGARHTRLKLDDVLKALTKID